MTSVHAVEAGSSRTQDDPYVEEDGTDRSALQNGHLAAASQNDSKKVPVAPTAHVETRRRIAHYAGLVLASMIGCIIRLGLEAMGDYAVRVIFPLAWAQGVGCGIMGLALARKAELTELYPPLYTFLTTGVAGSVTTFSSWVLEGYQAFANSSGAARSGFYDTVDGVAYSFATFAISVACLYWGEHVSRCLPRLRDTWRRASRERHTDPSDESASMAQAYDSQNLHLHPGTLVLLDYLTLLSAVLAYLVTLLLYFLAPTAWRHRAIFPMLLSPPGAIIRFSLAQLNLNPMFIDRFPMGTFAANISGSLLIGGVYAAQYLPSVSGQAVQCNALWSLQQGLCGCLTTVSTLAVESRTIQRKRRTWIYIGSSVILGHLCILVTLGAASWSGVLGDSICSA